MHPAYFETHFLAEMSPTDWPAEFAIITAFATTGANWTPSQNEAADKMLESELRAAGKWLQRLTGFSPTTGHAEPGWAVDLSLAAALELGCRYKQDAIFFVINDALHVTLCGRAQEVLVPIGSFRQRVRILPSPSAS